ncbi:hypothetical protein XbC2_183 [Xanthomonas phage XbC2]|nr:hypothetical protein XbC2_183 [Xanthomonas phage XbC2]
MIKEVAYKIRDMKTGQFVELLSASGNVVNSTNGKIFDTYSSAMAYLYESQSAMMRNKRYINLNRFSIHELRLVISNTISVPNLIESTILAKPEDEEYQEWFKSIVSQAVLDGFCEVDQTLLNFALTNDKYHSILVEYVPPHMLQCLDEFMSVGINGCDLDTLGSISLTASQKQLNMYDIDRLFAVRTEKISK